MLYRVKHASSWRRGLWEIGAVDVEDALLRLAHTDNEYYDEADDEEKIN